MRTCLTLAHPMVPTPLISGMLLLSHSIANYACVAVLLLCHSDANRDTLPISYPRLHIHDIATLFGMQYMVDECIRSGR